VEDGMTRRTKGNGPGRATAPLIVLLLLLCAVLVAGCGRRETTTSTASPVTTAAPMTTTTSPPTTMSTTTTTLPTTTMSTTTTTLPPTTTTLLTTTTVAPTSSTTGGGGGQLTGDAAVAAANWQKFFDPATSATDKATLLQNGPAHADQLQQFASNPFASFLSLPVTAVTISGSTATVTYNVSLAGSQVATGQTGTMVLENGVWKISEATFQALLNQASSFGGA
jgi:hypothetical protein